MQNLLNYIICVLPAFVPIITLQGQKDRSQQNIRKNEPCQMRNTKMSTHSSAKMSGETIIKGKNIMIGKHNTLISTEDCKCSTNIDDMKHMLDGFSSRIFEMFIKFDTLMQKLDGLSAIVSELSRKLNCSQSELAEMGVFAVPCNYVQNVASGTSKFRHTYPCCWKKTPAKDSASFFVEASTSSNLETDALSSNKPTQKDDTENLDLNSDMEQGNCSQDRDRLARSQQNIRKNKTAQMRKTNMSYHSSAKRLAETVIKNETSMMEKYNTATNGGLQRFQESG